MRRSASRESSPSLKSCCLAFEPRLRGLELERLDLQAAVEIDQRLLERQPGLRLLVVLDLEVLHDLLERQHRLADVELHHRIALFQVRARPLEDPQHARVERAREHALDLGGDRAGRHDDRLDGPRRDPGGADPRAVDRRAHPARKPDDDQRQDQNRHRDLEHPPAAILSSNFWSERAVHTIALINGRAVAGLELQRLRGRAVMVVVRDRTKGCSEADSFDSAPFRSSLRLSALFRQSQTRESRGKSVKSGEIANLVRRRNRRSCDAHHSTCSDRRVVWSFDSPERIGASVVLRLGPFGPSLRTPFVLARCARESNGGGAGIRTPVRKYVPAGIYDAYPPL